MKSLLREQAAHREQASTVIRTRLQEHPVWTNACTIALFASLPNEPDLLPLLQCRDKTFVFPVVQGTALLWRRVASEDDLLPGPPPLHLREPVEGPTTEFQHIDLLLVPGLAFTKEGARLGRGGGFYDRALARRENRSHPATLGVCFSFQVVDALPTEPHDQPVSTLLHG